MGWIHRITALAVAFLMVGMTFQPAVANMFDGEEGSGTRLGPMEEIPGPFRDLDTLVEELIRATTNLTDSDNDSIPDRVEWVIGTDPDNPDSDCDTLWDMDEVVNKTDPMKADSNDDGLVDPQEVRDNRFDLDRDGTPNAWDSDNDGDGVEDSLDMSVFSRTVQDEEFQFEVRTSGGPTSVNFQLRTSDPDHLSLVGKVYDWPYDKKGQMRDLDRSKADVFVEAILELHGDDLPDSADLEGYGITGNESVAFIPLYPVKKYGEVVALQGQMYFPATDGPVDRSFDIVMRWRVSGASDKVVKALRAGDGMYLSVMDDGPVRANASQVGDAETFEWEDLGNNQVALKAANGNYLSMEGDWRITASSPRLTEFEKFAMERVSGGKIALKAYNGKYLRVRTDGSLSAIVGAITNLASFELVDEGYRPEMTTLAYYNESFYLTGCVIEEHHGVDVGVFYHPDDVQHAVAANIFLSYEFMRNATSEVYDLPSMLSDNDFEMEGEIRSFDRMDTALETLLSNLTKSAMDKLQGDDILPIITAMKERGAFAEMDSMGPPSLRMGTSLQVDVTSIPVIEIKTMKTNWYNASEEQVVEIEEVIETIRQWELPEEDHASIAGLLLVWNVGEQIVTKQGIHWRKFSYAEHKDAVHLTQSILQKGITGFKGLRFVLRLGAAGAAFAMVKVYNMLRAFSMADPKPALDTAMTVFSTTGKTFKGVWGFINTVNIALIFIGAFIDLAVILYTFFSIIGAYEWSTMGVFIASIYLVMKTLYVSAMLMLSMLSFIPYVGFVFTIIAAIITLSDLISMIWLSGGWTQYLMELIVDLVTNIEPFAELDMQVLDSDVDISDKGGNGLTVGDRITYSTDSIMWKNTTEEMYYNTLSFRTYIQHQIDIYAPGKSHSSTGNNTIHGKSDTDGKTYRSSEVTHEGWVEPGVAMINFPVTIQHSIRYHIYYNEDIYIIFEGWQSELKLTEGWIRTTPFTICFDVMPASIGEFQGWRAITAIDSDGDGINNTDEEDTDPWKWDTDGDGLGDKYELDIGTDPALRDMDGDGLSDKEEHVQGLDPGKRDTDGDGLTDYMEYAGWLVTFEYEGKTFDWHVNSDAHYPDLDGDGIDDAEERLTLQNPRSRDTDGDGVQDTMRDYHVTKLEFKRGIPWTGGGFAEDVVVDEEGYIYATFCVYAGGSYVAKFAPDGSVVGSWTFGDMEVYPTGITLDADGNLWICSPGGGEERLIKMSRDGTVIDSWRYDSVTFPVIVPQALAFDDYGNLYITESEGDGVAKLSPNMTRITSWGGSGTGAGQFDSPRGIAVDEDGYVYVVDQENNRVQKFDSDGNYVLQWGRYGHEPGLFDEPRDVAVDENGYIIVSEGPYESELSRIQKFDPVGSYVANMSEAYPIGFTSCSGIGLSEGSIYVADYCDGRVVELYNNVSVVHVDPVEFPDADGDGLLDGDEKAGWETIISNSTGLHTLNVSSDPLLVDTDGDGLNDTEERGLGSDPRSVDTDGDGLSDGDEHLIMGTNLTNWDSDGDGLDDGIEMTYGSDPLLQDTDDEGLSDLEEFVLGSHPNMTDTDGDGLDDAAEDTFSSSLVDPDPDEDTMFDSQEFELGTSPGNPDHDGDELMDGYELLYETDATRGDTDGDDLLDGFEVALGINPLANDTDGDGLTDSTEIEFGLNPKSGDSDGDNVPDSLDRDFDVSLEGTVYVVADLANDTAGLVEKLAEKVSVKLVTAEQLLSSHKSARYVVLVGPISSEVGTPGALMRALLEDAPDVLAGMQGSQEGHMAVLFGAWTPTQTVVMVSRTYPSDHYRVLGILRSVSVEVTRDSIAFTYLSPRSCFRLDDLNTIKATDASVWTKLDDMAEFSVEMAKYNEEDTHWGLGEGNGLGEGEVPMGKYLRIEVSENLQGENTDLITGATLWLYYTEEDLDRTGDGDADDPPDIDEATLTLYAYDADAGAWERLTPDLDWVEATGLDTKDVGMYGESYAGVLWANITRLSLFSAGGRRISGIATTADPGPDIEVMEGEEVTFDGSASKGTGGIVRHTWTFKHEGRTVTLHGEAPNFTFTRAGSYRVTLEVEDAFGGVDKATFTVTVRPTTILVRVGPVVDEGSRPVFDATVRITWGETLYVERTGFSGFADLTMDVDAIGDEVSVRITKAGYEPQDLTAMVTAEGAIDTTPDPMVRTEATEPPSEDQEGIAAWKYAIAIAFILLVFAYLVLFAGRDRRGARDRDEKEGS